MTDEELKQMILTMIHLNIGQVPIIKAIRKDSGMSLAKTVAFVKEVAYENGFMRSNPYYNYEDQKWVGIDKPWRKLPKTMQMRDWKEK